MVPRILSPSAKFILAEGVLFSPLPDKQEEIFMTLYEELKARGLVAQITDEEIIDLINNGKATFYIGFDCTADLSLIHI